MKPKDKVYYSSFISANVHTLNTKFLENTWKLPYIPTWHNMAKRGTIFRKKKAIIGLIIRAALGLLSSKWNALVSSGLLGFYRPTCSKNKDVSCYTTQSRPPCLPAHHFPTGSVHGTCDKVHCFLEENVLCAKLAFRAFVNMLIRREISNSLGVIPWFGNSISHGIR